MCVVLPPTLLPHLCGWEEPPPHSPPRSYTMLRCWAQRSASFLSSSHLPLLILFGRIKVRDKRGEMKWEISSPKESNRIRTVVLTLSDSWVPDALLSITVRAHVRLSLSYTRIRRTSSESRYFWPIRPWIVTLIQTLATVTCRPNLSSLESHVWLDTASLIGLHLSMAQRCCLVMKLLNLPGP